MRARHAIRVAVYFRLKQFLGYGIIIPLDVGDAAPLISTGSTFSWVCVGVGVTCACGQVVFPSSLSLPSCLMMQKQTNDIPSFGVDRFLQDAGKIPCLRRSPTSPYLVPSS